MTRFIRHTVVVRLLILLAGLLPCSGTAEEPQGKVDRLIEELGSKQFPRRERATRELEALGESALKGLKKAAADSADAEVRRRAAVLIGAIESRPLRCLTGHSGEVLAVAFVPGGALVVSGGLDKTIRLWDLEAEREIRRFRGHAGVITSLVVSSDGKFLLSGSADKTVMLWEAATGKEVRRFSGHTSKVTCVAFSPDDRWVVSGSNDETIRVWRCETGAEVRRFRGHYTSVKRLAVSPDGHSVVSSGGAEGNLRLWTLETAAEPATLLRGHLWGSDGLAFSSDGKKLLSVSDEGDARVWDISRPEAECEELTGWEAPRCHVHAVKFVRGNPLILSGGVDGIVRLWDGGNKKTLRVFGGHQGAVQCLAFSSDGLLALSGGKDGTIRVWQFPK